MRYPILSLLTVFVVFQSCVSSGNSVSPDETAKRIFTRTELEGISRMIHFVDSIVSEKTGLRGINESYRAYIDKLYTDVLNGDNFTPLLNDSAKFQFLETIDNNTFSAIWRVETVNLAWNSQPIKHIRLNSIGKYMEYLQEIGESDELYAKIKADFDMAGDFSPTTVVGFLKNHHELDFTIYKHRLWATIFLLNIAEPIEFADSDRDCD